MNIFAIGVQQILPRTGTGWQDANPSPNPPANVEADKPPVQPDRSPPAPGTGHLIDKSV